MVKNVNLSVLTDDKTKESANAALKEIKEALGKEEINVGNNGYSIGQTFTLTGVVALNDYNVNGNTGKTPQVETMEGTWISLRALMGLSSPRGYQFIGDLIECKNSGTKNAPVYKSEDEHKITLDCDITPEEYTDIVWNIPTRDLIKLYAILKSDPTILKGSTLTYHGIIGRIATAADTKNGRKAGEKFAITSRVWQIS